MTISDAAKDKPQSERFYLVRLTPARCMNDDLTLSGGVYQATFPFPYIEKVQRNGADLTEDGSAPGTNDHWYFDGTTLQVKLAAAPSATNVIVVFYKLHYTTGPALLHYTDPEDDATDLVWWQDKIPEEAIPRVTQSIKNIITGTFSLSDGSLEIIDTDHAFVSYLGANDSFKNKDCKIWVCIDGTDDITPLFEGKMDGISVSAETARINFFDFFGQMSQNAFYGDTAEEAYYFNTADSFPDVYPPDAGKPCPLLLARLSRHALRDTGSETYVFFPTDDNDMMRAICTDYTANGDATQNRDWGTCRVPGGFRTLDFGTPSDLITDPIFGTYKVIQYSAGNWATHNIEVGDSFEVTGTGPKTNYFRVTKVDDAAYEIWCFYENVSGGGITGLSGTTFVTHSAPALYIRAKEDNRSHYPWYPRDYSWSASATSGGNYFGTITFEDDFETGLVMDGSLNPDAYDVFFRTGCDANQIPAGVVLKRLCQESGLAVNASSFDSPSHAFGDTDVAFEIPQFDESDYDTNLKYAQEILKSVFGYIRINSSFEAEYGLFDTPSSSEVIDADRYLEGIVVDVDYNDIVTQMIAYNPHDGPDQAASSTETSLIAQYLHGVVNINRFRHVLSTISARLADILAVRSTRRATYRFATATENIDKAPGDHIQLDSPIVLGGGGSKDLVITGVEKHVDETVVEATDLEGL